MKNIKDYDLLKYCVMKAIRHLRQFYSSVAILNWNTGRGGLFFLKWTQGNASVRTDKYTLWNISAELCSVFWTISLDGFYLVSLPALPHHFIQVPQTLK